MSITVYYYQARGRANQIRLALAVGGAEFADAHPDMSKADGIPSFLADCRAKGGNAMSNTPMVEMDGIFYTQSSAALRAVGRKFNILPTDPAGAYKADKLIADCDEIRTGAYKCVNLAAFGMFSTAEVAKGFRDGAMPKGLADLERQLGDEQFFGGAAASVIDATAFDVVDSFICGMFKDAALDAFPKLTAWRTRFAAIPSVAKYLASEQYSKLMGWSPEALPEGM